MTGHVRQLPNGRWRAFIFLGYIDLSDGRKKRDQESKVFPSKREANAWVARRITELEQGTHVRRGRATVATWLTEWLAQVEPDLESASYAQYEQHVRLHLTPRIGSLKLSELKPSHVARLYSDLQREQSAAMAAKVGTTLKTALKAACAVQLIASNPAREVKKPRAPRGAGERLKVWNRDQIRAFLAAASGHRLEALFHLAIDTGMRQGELFGLHWPEVDLEAATVRVVQSLGDVGGKLGLKATKNESSRRVLRVCERTRDLLASMPRGRGPVFGDRRGGFLRKSNFLRNVWRPLIQRAGLEYIGFHGLRHTCATQLLMGGVNIRAVSSRLGHASVTITLNTYSHWMPEMDSRILEVTGELTAPAEVGVV